MYIIKYQPGDLILSEGSFGTKMYFIQQGTVDVLSMDDDVIAQLTDGAYFGGERGLEEQTKLIWPHLHFFNFAYLCDEK